MDVYRYGYCSPTRLFKLGKIIDVLSSRINGFYSIWLPPVVKNCEWETCPARLPRSNCKKAKNSNGNGEETQRKRFAVPTSQALVFSQNMGLEVTRKQIWNLKRSVPSSVSGPSGRRVVTTLENVRDIVSPSGVVFSSRLFIDTTFNLTDSYVTLLLAESPNFITKASSKPRVFPHGYLVHSHKTSSNHDFFAEKIRKVLEPLVLDKVAPAILLDGESSLRVYGEDITQPKWRITYMLVESAMALPKLQSGLILQYNTTNPAENFNKLIKQVI
ncbi:hypothetical protein L5515_015666 [Caenorhabditis briggsae]|uniref:Uncharacterized protein n=1 Tax=Caenorhabditis briggsae TaxID=6238 RepID=A0AAE9EGP0_CAEBR|nr:hypothetical protein L5515_015665 [Caenorhabditis briggsae]UMM20368.1 hypothetical protein L5515_015666 [Caenorhabditis briggsae]